MESEDDYNFKMTVGSWEIIMDGGELFINDVFYEMNNPDDPSYELVREIRRLRSEKK